MASEIRMPASGQNAAESVIVTWHVKEGDEVDRGDVLFDIETDKATMSVESYARGTVLKVCYREGDTVQAGKVVAYIGQPGEAVEQEAAQNASPVSMEDEYKPIMKGASENKANEIASVEQVTAAEDSDASAVMASPRARKLAKESGVDIAKVYDTMKKVVKSADISAWKESSSQGKFESVKPSGMRKTIARRMLQSTTEAPQFTITIKPDMTAMVELRNSINSALENEGVKVSYNDLLAKCVSIAIKKAPYINSVYTDEEIRLLEDVNVGIAVGLPDGLVVPVVENIQKLTIKEIAQRSKTLIEKAKSGKLETGDMRGGTITISNLGMYGISSFTALVNRPESAILAVGSIVETPVGLNGEVALRPIMDITASFDHRIIDGSVGAQFMAELKKLIEQPLLVMV